jgi:predicted small secreted protein
MQGKTHGLTRRLWTAGMLLAMLAFATLISGCNTIEGVGKDVSAAGQTVADWASDDETGSGN